MDMIITLSATYTIVVMLISSFRLKPYPGESLLEANQPPAPGFGCLPLIMLSMMVTTVLVVVQP